MSASFNTILSLGRAGGIIEAFFSYPNDVPPKMTWAARQVENPRLRPINPA
jgi:hypothetical protein